MDRVLLNSTSHRVILQFVQSVVQNHEVASGLKQLSSHDEIVDYACSKGFHIEKGDWDEFIRSDIESLNIVPRQSSRFFETNHWSWAFRQVSSWRAMLMEGADQGSS